MTALTRFLFPAPAHRTVGGILRWWEARRPAYNLVVGGAGLVSLAAVGVISALPPFPRGMPGIPWQAVVAFGLLANVCYLLGPAVEVAVEKLGRGQVLPTGPVLFRMGLTFSVGLALLPTLLILIAWIVRIAFAIF